MAIALRDHSQGAEAELEQMSDLRYGKEGPMALVDHADELFMEEFNVVFGGLVRAPLEGGV